MGSENLAGPCQRFFWGRHARQNYVTQKRLDIKWVKEGGSDRGVEQLQVDHQASG